MNKREVNAEDIMAWCAVFISEQLHIPKPQIDVDVEFDDLGLDSALVTAMLIEMEEWLGIELSPSVVFEEPTLRKLGEALSSQHSAQP
jgi:acyl carrier protein